MWDVESSSGEEIREGSKGSSLVFFSGGVDVSQFASSLR